MRLFISVLGLMFAVTAAAGLGPPAPAFYVDGVLYRTIGTPTDLPDSAPEHTFDVLYDVDAFQEFNVSAVAPGDKGYNGGRWMAIPVEFDDYDAALAAHDANGSGDFDSDEEIEAALAAGDAVAGEVAARFVCPVIKVPRSNR